MSKKMIVWGLFDSGNGSYTKAIKTLNGSGANIEVYPIGIDIENKNNHFIELDLADYKRLFGDNKLFDTLDKLPRPDLIIASPPCESWSVASAMNGDGNACWKQEDLADSLFAPQKEASMFTIRTKKDYSSYRYHYDRQFMKRVNGELCIFNTIEIIKRYEPDYFIIENPANSRIWRYIVDVIGFPLKHVNLTRYNNYDYPIQKPTKFAGNIFLGLDSTKKAPEMSMNEFSRDYNVRSDIPQRLVIEIFTTIYKMFKEKK
ncbi:DNA methyltransferase [Streptococcus oralis subsp. tigurinus]|uniref:DNA methyltransferase n=1 Tax=Streptococcus oralis TaxID=1303 RepID=UPI00205DDF71|nr:MAG TPA: DNA methyltransferase [Caudoviricetes sp.]DAU15254.1 MAG TPA: DNA methyltransferase [Caudoviricetes sp.]